MNSLNKYYIHIIITLSVILLLANLGNQYMWQDEAQTCLISSTILEKGLPYGTDGKNYFSQELGAEYGDNYLWKWHTWLPFYIQAFLFWLFGTSNFIARLPFALFGVGSVIYSYLLTKKLFGEKTALITSLMIITSVAFLVLSRQARLYSPSIMFSMASLYYFIQIKQSAKERLLNKNLNLLYFILCTTFLFHTHYFYYATFFISIGLYLLLFERDKIKDFVLPTIISGIINLPWMIWFRDIKYHQNYTFNFDIGVFKSFLWVYSYDVFKHILGGYSFFILLLIIIFITVLNYKSNEFKNALKPFFLLSIFGLINLIFISVFTPAPHFRYLCVFIIPTIILISYFVSFSSKYFKPLPFIILAILTFFSPFKHYLHELTSDYDGPLEGISKYLNENADKNGTVLITYGDMPVKWHTGLRTYGGLTGENLALIKKPDWLIYRKETVCHHDQKVKDFIDANIDLNNYRKIIIPYPDYMFENREDPSMRYFKPKTINKLNIYKLIN